MKIMCTELSQIDKRCIQVGFFSFILIFFLRFVCFVLYLFVFDNRLIFNFISFFFCFEDITSEGPTHLYILE